MKPGKPTILDVAKRANVSVGTVSNVLNGSDTVSKDLRRRVMTAVKELSYSQNLLARSLRKSQSPMVGLCVPHTSSSYFSALVNAFDDMASDRGVELLQVLSHEDPKEEMERVGSLLKYKIGGLILLPTYDPTKTLKLLAQSGTPTVLVDRVRPIDRFDNVTFDNYAAMFEGTREILALGHRRLLFIVRQKALSITQDRMRGYQDAVDEASSTISAEVLECPFDQGSVLKHLSQRFRNAQAPTAVIVSTSSFAAWTLQAFRTLGVDYPRTVSLLVFEEPEWAELVTPTLSVVRQPTEAVARRAWEFLIRRMNDDPSDIQSEQLKARLVFRDSVAPIGGSAAPKIKPHKRVN